MRRLRFKSVAAAVVLVLSVAGCSDPDPNTLGGELFLQSCARCHGASGEGTTGRPPIGAGSNAATLTDEQILGVMDVGPGAMPSFRVLTPEQLQSLVVYVRELQGAPAAGE